MNQYKTLLLALSMFITLPAFIPNSVTATSGNQECQNTTTSLDALVNVPLMDSYVSVKFKKNKTINMVVGETIELDLSLISKAIDLFKDYEFTSLDEEIVHITIDEDDKVLLTGISEGETKITYTSGKKKSSCNVVVASEIEFECVDDLEVVQGESKTIEVTSNTNLPITYTSSNEDIAKVSDKGKVSGIEVGEAIITVSIGDQSKDIPVIISKDITLTLDEESIVMGTKDTHTLNVITNSTKKIKYKSSDTKIVKVDSKGKLTAKNNTGEAQITISIDGCDDIFVDVVVEESNIKSKNKTIEILEGEIVNVIDYIDSNCHSFRYTSKKSSIAKVSSTGEIEGRKSGSTIITVKTNDGESTKLNVTVKAFTFYCDSSLSVILGKESTLYASTNGHEEITYKSEDSSIAQVDNTGKITGKAEGSTIITVSTAGIEKQCKVTVEKAYIKLISPPDQLVQNHYKQLQFESNLGKKAKYSSSNPHSITVDENGKITARHNGSSTITVTIDGVSAQCNVKVNPIYVYVSKTNTYHERDDCWPMIPKNATRKTLDEAVEGGAVSCSKCIKSAEYIYYRG